MKSYKELALELTNALYEAENDVITQTLLAVLMAYIEYITVEDLFIFAEESEEDETFTDDDIYHGETPLEVENEV